MTTTDLEKARQAADDANAQLAAAQAAVDAATAAQAAADAAAAQHRRDTATTYYEQKRRNWPADHRGELDTSWENFVAAVRNRGNITAAWVDYRCTRAALNHGWAEIAAHFDRINQETYEARRKQHGILGTDAGYLATANDSERSSNHYREHLAAWNASAAEYTGTERPADAPPFVPDPPDRPKPFVLTHGYAAQLHENETFEDCLQRAVRIIEREHHDTLAAQRSAEIDKLATKGKR